MTAKKRRFTPDALAVILRTASTLG